MRYLVTNERRALDWNATGDALLLQNLSNLLRSWTGEIPFLYEAGMYAGLQDMATPAAEALLVTEVHRLFDYYAGRVDIEDVRITRESEGVRIEVEIEVDGA